MKLAFLSLPVFFALLFSGCVDVTVRSPQPNGNTSSNSVVTGAEFSCKNNNSVGSRGYVLLMGLGGHHKDEWAIAKRYMAQDPKARFVEIYDQDETTHLPEISAKFLSDMHVLLAAHPVEELVLFGSSAGGVTSSYSIAKLNFSGPVALHTMASPLKGYDFSGIKENLLGNRSGFLRDIAIGFQPFDPPAGNVKVYHHKTVTDTILVNYYCRGFEFLCSAVEIQNNNIAGSKEFFYPQFDHDTIMPAVLKKVLKCYNANLSFPEDSGAAVASIGAYCTGVEECNFFCHSSRGQCDKYCSENPSNPLCRNSRYYGVTSSEPRGEVANKQAVNEEIASDGTGNEEVANVGEIEQPPVLNNLGVSIENWDRATNRAGDVVFDQRLVASDKPFVDFGSVQSSANGPQETIEYWFYVPLGTKLRAPVNGVVSDVGFFNHTGDRGISIASRGGSQWFTSFEHVVNVTVEAGDRVNAGEFIAEAAPRNSFNYEIAMVELVVWTGGRGITKYCPFSYLNESLKPIYTEKINRLASNWEEFAGKEVYQQEQWVAPGCLKNAIVER